MSAWRVRSRLYRPRRMRAMGLHRAQAAEAAAVATPSPAAPVAGLNWVPLRAISRACGVSEHILHHYVRPLSWGVPGHWRFVGGNVIYKASVMPELVVELRATGRLKEAADLETWWAGLIVPPPLSSDSVGWLRAWEEAHDV